LHCGGCAWGADRDEVGVGGCVGVLVVGGAADLGEGVSGRGFEKGWGGLTVRILPFTASYITYCPSVFYFQLMIR
jgi:hypothetical protein